MNNIRITKIDGQEFVPYKDYLRLKEEKENIATELFYMKKNTRYSRIYDRGGNENGLVYEDFQTASEQGYKRHEAELRNRYVNELEKEVRQLKKDKQELEYLGDINEELKEENKKLKYVIDSVMEKEGIEYIRTSYGDVFLHPQNGYHILDDSINKGQ